MRDILPLTEDQPQAYTPFGVNAFLGSERRAATEPERDNKATRCHEPVP